MMRNLKRRALVEALPLAIPGIELGLKSGIALAGTSANDATRKVKFVHTEFGDIAYTERGKGPPALFIHAAFMNGCQWRHVVERVADVRRTIAIDLLAHGETKIAADQDVSFPAQANMLQAVCDKLNLAQVDLIANDSGGGIAQIFAARHPERVRTLTLTNCDTHNNWPPPQIQRLRLASEQQYAGLLQQWLGDVASAREAFSPGYEHAELISAETFRAYFEPLLRTPESLRNSMRFFLAADNQMTVAVEPLLKQLNAPTLIVWGMDDPIFDVKWAYWLRDTIPGTRKVIELQNARLFFPEERHLELADALRDHWRESETEPEAIRVTK